MAEWDDVELDQSSELESKRKPLWLIWVGVAVLAFALGFYLFFTYRRPEPPPKSTENSEPPSVPEVAAGPPTEPEPEPERVDLPLLDESDSLVRKLIGTLTSHVEMTHWLTNEELIRTFVVVVDNVAEGVSPVKHLPFLKPGEPFKAVYDSGAFYIDPKSYDRYNLVAEVFSSINARSTADIYRDLKPLIQQAYTEIGYPDKDFDETLAIAIDHLLMTPVPDQYLELSGETVSYKYMDDDLEDLSEAQKQFMRMGPQNVQNVKSKLVELKGTLRLASTALN
jgi:hypothetical protein